eukprot:4747468-Pyramimonas_sp.AAC.2
MAANSFASAVRQSSQLFSSAHHPLTFGFCLLAHMSFSQDEIEALAQTAPEGSFLEAPVQKISKWIASITSVDGAPKEKHPLIFYGF